MTTPTSQNSGRQSRKNIVFPNAMILPKNSLPPPSEGTTRGGITMPKQAFFPFTSFRRGKSPYPVWTNSQRADWGFGAREIQPPKHPTEERKRLARLYRKARRWKARNPKFASIWRRSSPVNLVSSPLSTAQRAAATRRNKTIWQD